MRTDPEPAMFSKWMEFTTSKGMDVKPRHFTAEQIIGSFREEEVGRRRSTCAAKESSASFDMWEAIPWAGSVR